MAAFVFKVNTKGADAKLSALLKTTANMQPVFATVGRVLANRIRLCFKLGIDPWGSPWAALKIRKGQPLRDTGRLQRSIVANPDKTGVTIGTNMRQARLQQFGGTIQAKPGKRLVFPGPGGSMIFAKRVTIPGRPFMPIKKGQSVITLPPAWSADAVRALRDYFLQAVNKVGA